MDHFESKKTYEKLIALPGYEINDFLDSRLIQEEQVQKANVSKITTDEATSVAKNAADLPPSCELVKISKDDSVE